jgi:hypothetical protein
MMAYERLQDDLLRALDPASIAVVSVENGLPALKWTEIRLTWWR